MDLTKKKIKTWKLGEVCQGGIITVQTNGHTTLIQGKEWDYSKGSSKSSDQSGAKVFISKEFVSTNFNAKYDADEFLNELTTYYHAEQIADWIKEQVNYNF